MSWLWTALIYLVLGWGIIAVLARRRREYSGFLYLLGGAFTVHLVMGAGLYFLAAKANPVYPLQTLANWLLASDATAYHQVGKSLAAKWLSGSTGHGPAEAFRTGMGSFVVVVAALYSIFGPTPMAVIGFNAFLTIPLGVGARQLALVVGQDRTAASVLALLICLWPPALAWSSVILRESLCYVLVVWVMLLTIRLIERQGPFFRRPEVWAQMATMIVLTYLMTSVRWYLGRIIVPLMLVTLLWGVFQAGWGLAMLKRLGRSVIVSLVVVAGVTLGSLYCLEVVALRLTPGFRATRGSTASTAKASMRQTMEGIIPSLSHLNELRRSFKWNEKLVLQRRRSRQTAAVGASGQNGTDTPSAYLYQGVVVRFFLFPYPWDQWPKSQARSPVRRVIQAQSVFWYIILAGLILGVAVRLKGLSWTTIYVAGWLLTLGLALAYVVINLGTLYRLRDLAVVPVLVLVDLRPARWLWRRAGSWRRRHRGPAETET